MNRQSYESGFEANNYPHRRKPADGWAELKALKVAERGEWEDTYQPGFKEDAQTIRFHAAMDLKRHVIVHHDSLAAKNKDDFLPRAKQDEAAEVAALIAARDGKWLPHAHQDFEAAAQEIAIDGALGLVELNTVAARPAASRLTDIV